MGKNQSNCGPTGQLLLLLLPLLLLLARLLTMVYCALASSACCQAGRCLFCVRADHGDHGSEVVPLLLQVQLLQCSSCTCSSLQCHLQLAAANVGSCQR